jgi:serine/threonine-protein phosphatase 4 regulatory subunit 1
MEGSPDDKTTKRDILSIFELQFLRDTDDTVQLNVIRNLPSFLSLLSAPKRSAYLPILSEIINGDTMLASKRKNALNPVLLNWRQRDMVAQILPNLISLYPPDQVRQYLWPIVKTLLSDPVNIIRENIEWSIPILLRCYEVNNCVVGQKESSTASKFSSDSSHEVFSFLKATLLENHNPVISNGRGPTCGAFSKRQSYCRILSAIALILRVNEKSHRQNQGRTRNGSDLSYQSYSLTSAEYRHIHHLLKQLFLPPAMMMKEDRVTNVRLSLANCLRMLPSDIRDEPDVNLVLRTLEDEIQTWEGGGGQDMDIPESLNKPFSGNEDNRDSMKLDLGAFSRNDKDLLKERTASRNEDESSLASI